MPGIPPWILDIVVIGLALVISVIDIKFRRVPNAIVLPLLLAGAFLGKGFWAWSMGVFSAMLLFFPAYAVGGLGAGDVKMAAALGGFVGWPGSLWFAAWSGLAGGMIVMAMMPFLLGVSGWAELIAKRSVAERFGIIRESFKGITIAYAPAFAVGYILFLIYPGR